MEHTYCHVLPVENQYLYSQRFWKCLKPKEKDRQRLKTSVNIGVANTKWKDFMMEKILSSDVQVDSFLLDR